MLYNFGIFGAIVSMWVLFLIDFPMVGLKTCIGFSVVMVGIKLYNDRYMGISAYGDRKATLVIAEEFLEIRDVRIPFSELKNLVIYVDEYLGMPKGVLGIHHGGNNKIEFEHNGRLVSINYVIKNRQDYNRVTRLVESIEKDPRLQKNLKKLD